MIVAVDAAGGDFYPKNPIEGGLLALEENQELHVLFVGSEDSINKELEQHEYDHNRVHVQHASQVINMEESPALAVRNKQQSSIVIGLGAHKAGQCDAFVSAGNTGALMAASAFILGRLPGVVRPTIATYFPTVNGFRLIVDAGANLEIKPEMALQFAIMGQIFCRAVLGIETPKVGLLNVGEEEEKGTELLKSIHAELKSLPGFIGNVEGRDVLPGNADVFLCDGVVGNILLKFGESVPASLMTFIKAAVAKSGMDMVTVQAVQKLLKIALGSFNYENVGGIPFLGVNGISIVGHGGSSPVAIKNMIIAAIQCVNTDINGKIVASLN